MPTAEFKKQVYTVMHTVLANPKIQDKEIEAIIGVTHEELMRIFEYINREGLMNNLKPVYGGQRRRGPLMVFYDRASYTEKGIGFMDQFERNQLSDLADTSNKTVFVSYNWGDANSFVDSLENRIKDHATLIRDKKDIPAWGSITEFMRSCRSQDFVLCVISPKYLNSINCMFEVAQLMKETNWRGKAMFAIMDTTIYDQSRKNEIILYWQEKAKELENQADKIELALKGQIAEEANKIAQIKAILPEFLSVVSDSNNPQIWDVIDKVIERIKADKESKNETMERTLQTSQEIPPELAFHTDVYKAEHELSPEAQKLLIEAVNARKAILVTEDSGGFKVCIDGEEGICAADDELRATMESAIQQLEYMLLIAQVGSKGEVYKLTDKGYKVGKQVVIDKMID